MGLLRVGWNHWWVGSRPVLLEQTRLDGADPTGTQEETGWIRWLGTTYPKRHGRFLLPIDCGTPLRWFREEYTPRFSWIQERGRVSQK
ncbi:hypothetical protein CDL15_Pgr013862 [Punica granatum]|nr:hypothetical protein CDL15_Pgr013862 [Punica granatum]